MRTHTVGQAAANRKAGIIKQAILDNELAEVLKIADPGDLVNLVEGSYTLEPRITGLVVQGVGDPEKTILYARPLVFQGTAVLARCAVEYIKFSKQARAIRVEGAGSHLTIDSVVIRELTGGGSVTYGKVVSGIASVAKVPDVLVGSGSILFAQASRLGSVVVDGGRLFYTQDTVIDDLKCVNGGTATVVVPPATAAASQQAAPPPQHFHQQPVPQQCPPQRPQQPQMPPRPSPQPGGAGRLERLKEAARTRMSGEGGLAGSVVRRGGGRPAPQIGVLSNPVARREAGQVLPWPSRDGHSWDELIGPQLTPGLTVVLEEGEYWVPARKFGDLTIYGVGDPKRTVVNIVDDGALIVAAGRSLSLANLTLKPAFGCSAIMMVEGRSLSLTNVIVDHIRKSTADPLASLALVSGRTTIEHCEVRADQYTWDGEVKVADGAKLVAARSVLDCLTSTRAEVEVTDCQGYLLQAQSDGVITSRGIFRLAGSRTTEVAPIGAGTGGRIRAEQVVVGSKAVKIIAEDHAVIEIGLLEVPEGGTAVVECDPEATARVEGDPSRIRYEGGSGDRAETIEEVLAEIDGMVGLAPVKHWVHNLVKRVEFDRLEATSDSRANYHMVFYGNPGTGKTTVARLIGKVLFSLGVLPTTRYQEVDRSDIVSKWMSGTEEKMKELIDKSMGGVLFIDEAYQLVKERSGATDSGEEAIDVLLTALENNRGEFVAIFAGYTEPMDEFLDANPGLRSRLRDVNRIEFPDYSPAEVGRITADILRADRWQIDDAMVIDRVGGAYAALRPDERGNGRSARNFAEAIIEAQKEYVIDHRPPPEVRRHIGTEVLTRVLAARSRADAAGEVESIGEILAEIDSMVGLEPVKRWIRALVKRVEFDRMEGVSGAPANYHMVFYGSPGTGKTTVARLIGKLLYRLEVLPTTNYAEVDRSKVVGMWQGETEKNTRKLIDKAMGGVLFVDEAYQLVREKPGATDVGQEAIETLLTELENRRGEFVAIFAGYTEPMERFLDANEGLRSRIRDVNRIEFPDYSPAEVGRITADILRADRWQIDDAMVIDRVARAYAVLRSDERGNGRSARNFAEAIIEAQKEYAVDHRLAAEHRRWILPQIVDRALMPR